VVRVAVVGFAVHPNLERLAGRRVQAVGLRAIQIHAPDIEELPQRERAMLYRRLDVDDAVGGVRMQPIQACANLRNADLRGYLHDSPMVEHLQLRVDVLRRSLHGIAADTVDRQAVEHVLRGSTILLRCCIRTGPKHERQYRGSAQP